MSIENGVVRLAIIATPRSGNTWLRGLLADALGLEQWAVHNPSAFDWSALPQRLVLQIHWHRTEEFRGLLAQHGFRVITIARHPFDTLLSILHFAQQPERSQSEHWLGGEAGDESEIRYAFPLSRAFLDYAISPRARALLGITAEWWNAQDDSVLPVRYEDLVADPAAVVQTVARWLNESLQTSLEDVTKAHDLEVARHRSAEFQHHLWQGKPGLWRMLLTLPVTRELGAIYQLRMDQGSYAGDADPDLMPQHAYHNWLKLELPGYQEEMAALRAEVAAERATNQKLSAQVNALSIELADGQAKLQDESRQNIELANRLAGAEEMLAPVRGLNPRSVRIAWKIQRTAERWPRLAKFIKTICGMRPPSQ